MPRQQVKKEYFNFVGGLNTEAGPLNAPPNQWASGDNIIPQIDGSLQIRTSMNLEDSATWSTDSDTADTKTNRAYSCWPWGSAGGDGSRTLSCVQRGRYVFFYDAKLDSMSGTEYGAAYKIDLNTYKSSLYQGIIGTDVIQAQSANGKLLITSIATDPIVVTYTDSSVTVERLTVKFRDFEGVDDSLQGDLSDTEPTTLTANHSYNLLNQGWRAAARDTYKTTTGGYPSNAQQWYLGKDTDDNFDASLLQKQEFGKSQAPRGHYILSAFNRDRAGVSGTSVTLETENYRFETCAFYAGRAWFAGVPNSTKVGSWIFFSQVAFNERQFGYCYQQADPTSEETSELIASDGGVVVIQGIGSIHRLLPIDKGLMVFADNGVWMIAGSIDAGFSAEAYEVTKITNVGISGPLTAVAVEDRAYYWADDGIWELAPDQTSGAYKAKNATQTSIETRYKEVSATAREHCRGIYFQENKTVYWLYQGTVNADLTSDLWQKDKFICLDLRLPAWYTMTLNPLAVNSPYVYDFLESGSKVTDDDLLQIIDIALSDVIDGLGNLVAEEFSFGRGAVAAVKFLTVGINAAAYHVTWSNFEDGTDQAAKFKDWYDYDTAGITYLGHVMTGYDTGVSPGGDRKIQGNYITIMMHRTETGIDAAGAPVNGSSVLMSHRWDFTDNTIASRWSTPVEAYKHQRLFLPAVLPVSTFNDGYPVVITKMKLRGRGNAVQIRFESTANKDFKLIGWSIPVYINVD